MAVCIHKSGPGVVLCALGLLSSLPLGAGSTGSGAPHTPQGGGAPTEFGDYLSASAGLDVPYRYFIEVPAGASRLVVDLFDADVGAGGSEGVRDRQRGAAWDSSARYSLYDPSGVLSATLTGDVAGPGDNVWTTLLDSAAPAFGGLETEITGNNDVSSLTVARPAGTAAGDLLLFILAKDNPSSIDTPTGGAGGWTPVDEGPCAGGGGSCRLGIYRRVAQAGEPASYTITWAGAQEAVGAVLRFTGVDPTTPIDAVATALGSSASPTAPAVTTTVANTLLVRVYAADDDDLSAAPYPAGHAGRYNLESSSTAGSVSAGAADALQAAAGGSGGAAFSLAAAEEWRAVTLALRPGGGAPAAGHWELEVDMSSAETAGDDINALGLRAHDGDPTAGGTEMNVYFDSQAQVGVNPTGVLGASRSYELYPYLTSGCAASSNDFDFDSDDADPVGAITLTSRSGAFNQSFVDDALSANDSWNRDTFSGWTSDFDATDYGVWNAEVEVRTYTPTSGNYTGLYVGSYAAAANPPATNPTSGAFRVYLPADGGVTSAPLEPYAEQQVRVQDGPNPPLAGQTTTVTVTVRLVNPTAHAITFSSPSNLVTAHVPGGAAVYEAGFAQVSQGTVLSQPADGASGDVVWNPGTVAAGETEILAYRVRVTPASSGQRVPVTGTPAANGTTARFLDTTGNASQARATYLFGPLCELALTEGMLTHTTLARFAAGVAAGRVVVEWVTSGEAGTVGFELLRRDGGTGRWRPVLRRPLLARLGAPQGGTYRAVDAAALPGEPATYLLVEIEADGSRRPHGPFTVLPVADMAERVEEGEAATAPEAPRRRPGRGLTASPLVPAAAGEALKIAVVADGLHHLSAEDIAAGLGTAVDKARRWIERRRLRLTLGEEEVAWLGAAGGAGLYFYGLGPEGLYAPHTVYRLEVEAGLPMAVVETRRPEPGEAPRSFRAVRHEEEDRFAATAVAADPESDYWFWSFLRAGDPANDRRSFPLPAPAADTAGGSDAALTVELSGASTAGVAGEHHAEARLNGALVGETSWSGLTAHRATFPASAALLDPGGANTVEVRALLDPGVPASIFYVDAFELAYDRLYQAGGEPLAFTSGPQPLLHVDGLVGDKALLLDLSDPLRPARLEGFELRPVAGGYRLSFAPPAPGVPYLVLAPEQALSPAALWPDAPSDLRGPGNGAEYVVLTTAPLRQAAEDLADYRRGQGMTAAVVELEDVYDEFSLHQPDPRAVAAFLEHARATWRPAPRYLVLAGSGTLDYRDLLGAGDNLIPTRMTATGRGLYAADGLHAAGLKGGVPKVAVGRLPARDAAELAAYVAKLRAFEAGGEAWTGRVLLLADDRDQGADFAAGSEAVAAVVGEGYDVERLYLEPGGTGALRARLFAELAAGAAWLNYQGHGGLDRLAEEGLLTSADIPDLPAGPGAPVVAGLTCSINRFELPGFTSLGEHLVLAPEGGAVAVWAPSGLSHTGAAEHLNELLARRVLSGGDRGRDGGGAVLGDAILETLATYAAGGGLADFSAIYNLLGDPALRLPPAPSGPPSPPGGGSGE